MTEFALEGARLDFAEVSGVVGAEPASLGRQFRDVGGRRRGWGRWVLAVRSEAARPGDAMEQLGVLQSVLEGSADAIAAYCAKGTATASFRVAVDSETEEHPGLGLTHGFCAFAAKLGAGVVFELRTRREPGRWDELDGEALAESDGDGDPDADPVRLTNADAFRMLRSGRLVKRRSPPELVLGPVRRPERIAVAAGCGDDPSYEALSELKWSLGLGLAKAESGSDGWVPGASLVDGSQVLRRAGGARFLFTGSEAGRCAAVAAARGRVGIGIELAGRVFSPELVARFAPDEQRYINAAAAGDGRGAAGGEAGFADQAPDAGLWPVLPPAANARALEVWAKKQAWLTLSGSWPEGGLGGFCAIGPSAGSARFFPVPLPAAAGLTGWVCTADQAVTGVDATWESGAGR